MEGDLENPTRSLPIHQVNPFCSIYLQAEYHLFQTLFHSYLSQGPYLLGLNVQVVLTRWVPKHTFQLWYPGGQRSKVISFSWSWVKSPSNCFSNAEPSTIIASRDEKRCNASVQWTRLVHSRSLRLGDQHRKCHGWLLFFAVPDLHPDQRAAVQPHTGKQRIAKR